MSTSPSSSRAPRSYSSAERVSASIALTASTGFSPTAVSSLSMTASAPSSTAFSTSDASARDGRRDATIDASICVATMVHFPRRAARLRICFWMMGTCSKGSSTPRSPRATMIPSEASRIWSRHPIASGRSSFAITGVFRSGPRSRRASSMSDAERTNEMATRSTSVPERNARSFRSFSVRVSVLILRPGRLRPLWEKSRPPVRTRHTTSLPVTRSTASSMAPSASRMRAPGSTSSARRSCAVWAAVSEPSMSRGVSVNVPPSTSSTPAAGMRPMRSFGPWMSARTAIGRFSRRAASRIVSMSGPSVEPLPWEKLTRQASAPARMSSRMRSTVDVTGPMVAMILVHSIGYIG